MGTYQTYAALLLQGAFKIPNSFGVLQNDKIKLRLL